MYIIKLSYAARSVTNSSHVSYIPKLSLWLDTASSASFDNISDGSVAQNWYDLNPQVTQKSEITCLNSCAIYTKDAINGLPALRFRGSSTVGNYQVDHKNITLNYKKPIL